MQAAQKEYQQVLAQEIGAGKNIVIDGTAASYKKTEQLKNTLEAAGYDVMMVFVYSSLEKSLRKNEDRFERSGGEDRSLMPSIVLRTWRDVNKSIETYRKEFGNNFILINNNPKDANRDFNIQLLRPYLEDSKAKGKPKTPEQEAKSKQQFDELVSDITSSIKQLPKFDTIDSAKSKIKQFI